ncbi:MAG: hypothetical protein ACP5PZ_12165 [Bacteroidales bacterium]
MENFGNFVGKKSYAMSRLKIAFTNKEITPWGEMVLLKKMLDKIQFREVIDKCIHLPQPG